MELMAEKKRVYHISGCLAPGLAKPTAASPMDILETEGENV
jgi:hypothetical protein